jgi:FkbM family methyltransferase
LIRKTDDMIQSSWKPLYRHDLRLLGFPFDLYLTGVVTQFLLQQYHHEVQGSVISVIPGDIVIDAGGCYGDTAFNFAHKTGDEGHVYSFEFLPENLEVFAQNLKINPNFENRISIINHAVWEYSDLDMFVEGSGPGTKVKASSNNPNALKVKTLSIDDFVNQKLLKKIDFIKMDIEGSELSALKGAERCIREFKPNLAICIYHKLEDFWEIPKWIDSLEMGYQFHLGHYTIHAEETVLYAKVSN